VKATTIGIIYLLTCQKTGKTYVGQTTRGIKSRIKGHLDQMRHGSQLPIHRALRKYGYENFEVRVLEECLSVDSLNEAESRWIATYGSFGPSGYNCTSGGEGYAVSDETREKVSRARSGKAMSEDTKGKIRKATTGIRNHFYGRRHKPESIAQMKPKLSKRFSGEGNPFYGQKHSEESLSKMSVGRRGQPMHPNTREGIRQANLSNQYTKGNVLTISHREKLSKLKIEDVRYIRSNPDNLTRAVLATKFGVSWRVVYDVSKYQTWKEVA
jgi:group I intron endonuclease